MCPTCQIWKDRITWISERDKQTEKTKFDLMESIISEQGSFVTCECVREGGIYDISLFSHNFFLPLNHDAFYGIIFDFLNTSVFGL